MWLYVNVSEEHTTSFFRADYGGNMCLPNVGIRPKHCMTHQPKRQPSEIKWFVVQNLYILWKASGCSSVFQHHSCSRRQLPLGSTDRNSLCLQMDESWGVFLFHLTYPTPGYRRNGTAAAQLSLNLPVSKIQETKNWPNAIFYCYSLGREL